MPRRLSPAGMRKRAPLASTSRTGATSRSPVMSPNHQTRHAEGSSPAVCDLVSDPEARHSDRRADVVLTPAASTTSASTSRTRSSDGLETGDADEQVGADERLERVADRYADHRHGRHVPGERVGERRAERDSRPHPVAPDHQRGKRDARRRPDRRDAGMLGRELKPQLGGREIRSRHQEDLGRVGELGAPGEFARDARHPPRLSPPSTTRVSVSGKAPNRVGGEWPASGDRNGSTTST